MEYNSRNYGIDLLRILSMYMVVILHVLGQGGILRETIILSSNYKVVWLLEIVSYCAVNCYALISGYVGINAEYNYSNIIALWLRVIFYTVIITACFALVVPNSVGINEICNAIFPVMRKQYWYFTAYFCVFF